MATDSVAFSGFWSRVDRDLAELEPRPVLESLARHSAAEFEMFSVRLTSIGPYRIFAYLSVPTTPGRHPAVLELPHYGSVNNIPHWNDRLRYVVLTAMHRGQRQADEPFSASYPGLMTVGIEDPDHFVFRGIAADCLRSAEYLFSLDCVDTSRIAVRGNELALIVAARRRFFAAAVFAPELFWRAMDDRRHSECYPLEELNDYLRLHPNAAAAMERTFALFDPVAHASHIRAETAVAVSGDIDDRECASELTRALGRVVAASGESWGSGDEADWVDEWLAHRLSVRPLSRFSESPIR